MRTFKPNRIRFFFDHARMELTRGQWTMIDIADVSIVSSFRWQAKPNVMGGFYVVGSPGYLHRFLLSPGLRQQVDHINHDTLDNRRANLRLCSNAENNQNRRGAYRSVKTSGIRGVCQDKIGRQMYWKARVMVNYQTVAMKRFPFTEEGKQAAALWAADERAKNMPMSRENILLPMGRI